MSTTNYISEQIGGTVVLRGDVVVVSKKIALKDLLENLCCFFAQNVQCFNWTWRRLGWDR